MRPDGPDVVAPLSRAMTAKYAAAAPPISSNFKHKDRHIAASIEQPQRDSIA
jgi:hypothetical protein